ncbi:WD40/YVTN/BNR-like repeat-containing protein [Maricaulis maris]|uniref:WD40/YVTN/BNR-like repeat-containing protein n=1 Tax=Maricaulis maris TaxID=74318 RepID=UPI003A91A94C
MIPVKLAGIGGLAASAAVLAGCSGEAWTVTEQSSGVTSSLRGLSVVDDDTVWIGAPEGQVLRTVDGGASWQVSTAMSAEGADLRSAKGFDDQHALFATAGQPARILMTRDGGASFTTVWNDTSGSAFIDSLAFWDHSRGLAFSDPVDGSFLILRTVNGGESWQRLENLPAPLEGEAGFAASNSSIALTEDGCAFIGTGGGPVARILRSCDHGEHWDAVDTPLAAGSAGAGIFAVSTDRSGVLVASGGDYLSPAARAGNFAASTDRGESWKQADSPPFGYRSGIAGVGDQWISVGTSGVDVGSYAEGRFEWRESGWDIVAPNAIAFSPSGRVGWIIGADGGIWKLTPQ